MDDLRQIRTFLAVVQQGSFVQAARQLHVVPSVVAKRIAQLEALLGVRLFDRTTRRVQLTSAGEQLRTKASALLAQAHDLVHDIAATSERPYGHLRILTPTTLTTLHLGQLFARFMQENSRITLEVVLGNRSVNPLEESFDLVVSGRLASYEGVLQYPLLPIQYVLCAAPHYVASAAPLQHPGELIHHPCLVFEPLGRTWVFQSSRGAIHTDVQVHLLADDNQTVLHAALNGLGIAVLPGYIAQRHLLSGALQALLPAYPIQDAWFKAFIPKRKATLAHVVTLREYLMRELPTITVV